MVRTTGEVVRSHRNPMTQVLYLHTKILEAMTRSVESMDIWSSQRRALKTTNEGRESRGDVVEEVAEREGTGSSAELLGSELGSLNNFPEGPFRNKSINIYRHKVQIARNRTNHLHASSKIQFQSRRTRSILPDFDRVDTFSPCF